MTPETIFALAFIVFGSAFLIQSAWNVISGFLCRNWPRVQGVVIGSKLQEKADAEDRLYRAEVMYRYSVEGREYVSNRTRYGDAVSLNWSGPAERIVSKYRVGRVVTVRYNPEDPSEAVLEPGPGLMAFGPAFFGAMFVGFGIHLLRGAL